MDSSLTQDITQLSIFKCKVCEGRLRAPVYQVDALGNICGHCCDSSSYTNANKNLEIEIILQKLYISCNFSERGCTFKDSYDETCRHETYECRFRTRMCPFAYTNHQCEYEYRDSENIINHIKEEHQDNVLEVVDNVITMNNPTELNMNCFYFFEFDDTFMLVRAQLNEKKKSINYTFYYFDQFKPENFDIFSVSLHNKDKPVNFIPESRISNKVCMQNAISARLKTLRPLKEIRFKIKKKKKKEKVPTINMWFKCKKCLKVFETITYCTRCKKELCKKCKCRGITTKITIPNTANTKFSCGNCNEIISGNLYNIHIKYHCFKQTWKCHYRECTFTGFLREYINHMLETHNSDINQEVLLDSGESKEGVYTNGDDIFYHKYKLSKDNKLKIKMIQLIETFWSGNYIWVVNIGSEYTDQSVTVQGDYTLAGYKKIFDIGQYVKGKITLTTHIRRPAL